MNLYEDIYNFFNEARPRTVNKDVEDIRKGQAIYKGETPKDFEKTFLRREEPSQKSFLKPPSDINQKSSFKNGAVHRIVFRTAFKDQKKAYFSIYRKISEKEYKDLKSNIEISATVYPSDKKEHFEDVYYLNPGEGIRNEKDGFVHLNDAQIKEIKEKYSKYMTEFNPVSIEEIAKGLKIRYYEFDKLKAFWDNRMIAFKGSKDKGSAKAARDAEKIEALKTEIEDFIEYNKENVIKITGLHDKSVKPGISPEDKKDYEDLRNSFIKSYVSNLRKISKLAAVQVLTSLEEKLKDRRDLFDLIKSSYEGKSKPSTSTSTAKQKSKLEKPAKPSTDKASSIESKGGEFMSNQKHIVTLNRLINAFSESEDKEKNDRKEREYQRDQIFVYLPELLKQVNSFSKSTEVKDYVVQEMIRNRIAALTGDDNTELYNMISKTYDNMKEKESKKTSTGSITEAAKKYLIKTKPGSDVDNIYKKNQKDLNIGDDGKPIPGEYIVDLDVEQLPKLNAPSMKDKGIISIDPYSPKDEPSKQEASPEDKTYKVSAKIGGGSEQDGRMVGTKILNMLKADPQYKNITFADLKEKVPYKLKGKEGQDIVLTIKSLTPFGQSGKKTVFGTKDKKEDEPETRKISVRIPYQTPQTISYAVNKGVKMAKQNTSGLSLKFYVVDTEKKEIVKGFNNWGEAKKAAQDMGPKFKAMQRAEITSAGINEALSKQDIAKLKSTRVSFTIQSDLDPDKQYNISDNVREVKEEKGKIVLVLSEAGVVTFDKEGTGVFKYSKDNKEYQALNVPSDLNSMVKKALAPAKDTKEPESQLEAYIRKRIRQAIKEAEVSQYWGYQGADVKKKRLEEYLKRYDWGFQNSDNPYTHAEGSAKHAIVSKLVHELQAMGVDAIAIFNSYAPDEYQVTDLDQLDYASDSPLGSQLTQPYNPDSLTARGGRVAEMNGPVPTKGQGADQLDRLVANITPKLKADIIAKGNAKNAKELISVFRQAKGIADDVTDDMIYNKIKSV
jgi:hypothetical protein